MPSLRLALFCLLVPATLLSAAAPSQAETRLGRWELGVAPNYGWIVLTKDDEPSGLGASTYLRCGIKESFAVKLGGLWTRHTVSAQGERPGGTLDVFSVDLGLTYVVDFVSFQPKIEAGLGLLQRRLGGVTATDLGVTVGLAADYQISPRWSVGFAVNYRGFLTDLGNVPVYVEMGPRVAFQWGAGF